MAVYISHIIITVLAVFSMAFCAEELTINTFNKTVSKPEFCLVMFYANWCGFCQKAKPEFLAASATLLNEDKSKVLALFNCELKENSEFCDKEKIDGFPTFKLYQKGKYLMDYDVNEESDEKSFVKFMKNPLSPDNIKGKNNEEKETEESDEVMKNVVYLTAANFKQYLSKEEHAMVFFYTQWCPHCIEAKPKYEAAALETSQNKEYLDKKLTAINCDTEENRKTCESQGVDGYPTLRYYKKGEFYAEFEDEISSQAVLEFLKNPPKEKQPITPIEEDKSQPAKSEVSQDNQDTKMENVDYLSGRLFPNFIQSNKVVLVMFYAPWCSHCMEAKPVYQAVAKQMSGVKLAAVNCDIEFKLCEEEKVDAFPTIIHYKNGKREKIYEEQTITKQGLMDYLSQHTDQRKDEL